MTVSAFQFQQDTSDPARYTLLQQHIQQRIFAIQQQMKKEPSEASKWMDLLKGYISLKNVCIEVRRHSEERTSSK